jgi:hypothetical protein
MLYRLFKRISVLLVSFKNPMASLRLRHGTTGGRGNVLPLRRENTLAHQVCTFKQLGAECRDKKCRHRARRRSFSLDIPSYRTCPIWRAGNQAQEADTFLVLREILVARRDDHGDSGFDLPFTGSERGSSVVRFSIRPQHNFWQHAPRLCPTLFHR